MRRFFKKMMLLPVTAAAILWSGLDASAAVINLSGDVNATTYASNYINDTSEGYSSGYLGFSAADQYTVKNATVSTKAAFGIRHGDASESNAVVSLSGKNQINVMTYFGARSGSATQGVGGSTVVNIAGNNTFSTRVLFGGEGGYADNHTDRNAFSLNSGKVGKSTVTFTSGTTTFEHGRTDTKYGAYFSAMGRSDFFREVYHQINLHASDKAWMDAFLAEIKGKTFNIACNTEGTNLTFTGTSNTTFNSLAYIGGAYDLTTYNSVHTSSDDKDIVIGGTNNVNFAGKSKTTFYGRTFFGAAASTTSVTFGENSTTTFGGKDVFWSEAKEYQQYKGYALKDLSEYMAAGSQFIGDVANTYSGQDLPYVFFGGSDPTSEDLTTYNISRSVHGYDITSYLGFGDNTQTAVTTVNFKGSSTTKINTTAFFGGADDRLMAGDQVREDASGDKSARFFYGECTGQGGQTFLHNDTGACTVNLSESAILRLGTANTNQVLGVAYNQSGKYSYIRDRYEQVRLIGSHASFNGNGGEIQFDWSKHNQTALDDGNYSYTYLVDELVKGQDYSESVNGMYVINDKATAPTLQLDSAQLLDTGMMVFNKIHLNSSTEVNVARYTKLLGVDQRKEYYTTTALVGLGSDARYTKDGLELDLSNDNNPLDEAGNDLTVEKTHYSHLLYDVYVEDVKDETSILGSAVKSDRARLHIITKPIDDVIIDGNLANNKDTIIDILFNGEEGDPLYDAIEDILDEENYEEASKDFDTLTGAHFSDLGSTQMRRLTTNNSILATQLNSVDPCRPGSYHPCNQCNQCSQCNQCGPGANNGNCYWNVWGSFDGNKDKTRMNESISGYEADYYGGTVGADRACNDGTLMGAYFSFGKGSLYSDSHIGYTDVDSNDYTLGVYAKWLSFIGGGYTMSIANVGLSDYDAERHIYNNKFTSNYKSVLPSFYLEKGWVFYTSRNFSFNPFVAAQAAYYRSDAFSENGDASNWEPRYGLDVDKVSMRSLRTNVGLRLAYDMNAYGRTIGTIRGNAAWVHELLDEFAVYSTAPQYDSGYSPKPWHTVHSAHVGRDWANVGGGLNLNLTERLTLIGDYECFFNEYTTVHTGMATLRFAF